MSDRPDGFTKAMNLVDRHGYEDVREYVEQLEDKDSSSGDANDAPDEEDDVATFSEAFESAVEEGDVSDFTVSDLEDRIGEVDDPEVLEEAMSVDGRTTAQDVYSDRYEELADTNDVEGDSE